MRRWILIGLAVLITHGFIAWIVFGINRGSHAVREAFRRERPEVHGDMAVRFTGFNSHPAITYRYTLTVGDRFDYQASYQPLVGSAAIVLRVPAASTA